MVLKSALYSASSGFSTEYSVPSPVVSGVLGSVAGGAALHTVGVEQPGGEPIRLVWCTYDGSGLLLSMNWYICDTTWLTMSWNDAGAVRQTVVFVSHWPPSDGGR